LAAISKSQRAMTPYFWVVHQEKYLHEDIMIKK